MERLYLDRLLALTPPAPKILDLGCGTGLPIDKYLADPRAMVRDTSMIYAGLKNDAERADLVAYLETLH